MTSSKSKQKGTREERRQRLRLQIAGFTVRRLAEAGPSDEGDLEILFTRRGLTTLPHLVVESKDNASLNIHDAVVKANAKAGGPAVVWWKRTTLQPGNAIRTQVGKPIVAMPEQLFLDLLALIDEGGRSKRK